jgi:hypothetical protein
VSIDIKWTNIARQVLGVVDATNGYQGDFLETNVTIDVSVSRTTVVSASLARATPSAVSPRSDTAKRRLLRRMIVRTEELITEAQSAQS